MGIPVVNEEQVNALVAAATAAHVAKESADALIKRKADGNASVEELAALDLKKREEKSKSKEVRNVRISVGVSVGRFVVATPYCLMMPPIAPVCLAILVYKTSFAHAHVHGTMGLLAAPACFAVHVCVMGIHMHSTYFIGGVHS